MEAPDEPVRDLIMAPPTKDTKQISIRIPSAWLREADDLTHLYCRPGLSLGRTDIFRMALARGLDALKTDVTASAADARADRADARRRRS